MTIPPISLGLIKGAEWLKARNAEMFSFGQAHGLMNKNAEHTSVHALAGRLQAGPSGNLELTVPSSLIKGVFDALDEPGAEFVVRNNRTESAIKVMTKEEVDKLGGTSHITERGHSYHYTLGPIVELPATGDYDKLWAISIKSNDLEDIRRSYGLETSPQLGFYIPVGCKKKKVTEDNKVSKLAGVFYHGSPKGDLQSLYKGSYVTPDLETAKIMARFHEATGKPWTDDDLEEPYEFGTPQPKWKAGREPKGEPAIYRLSAAIKQLNLLDNPYEHTTLEELPVSKLAGLLKQSVYWSKDVSRDLLNGRKYPLSYLTGELGELGESVKNMDWPNFKEELGDSAYAAQMILAQKLGLNLPLIGASAPVDKFYARRKGWEDIFKDRGVTFSNDYLAGGSNLKKPKKIQAALGLAGHAITKDEARAFALKHGGGIEDDWTDDIGGVSKLARLLKRAGTGQQMGTPGGKPAAAPKGPSLNSTPPSGLGGNGGGMDLSGGRPKFDQGLQDSLLKGYANFQKNNPSTANVQYPAPVQGGSTRYKTNEEMTYWARQADLANKKMTWQQVEQMNPGEKMLYDRQSRPSNEQIASDQLAGKVDPNANSPFKPSGPPLSAKNQEMANMKHYTEQAYTDRQNLKPGSVAFNRSEQQRVSDETAGAIPQFVASTALAGPIGKVLGAGAKAIGGYVIPKIAPAFARWAAPAAHEAAHVAGHLGAESLLPAAYATTPTSIKSAPAWLGAKVVHEVGHQASNVSSAVGNAWNKAKGAMNSAIGPKTIPRGGTDIANTPYAGSDTNRSPTIQPEA